jgi:Golgi nucleoside diphosphatase
MEDHKIAQLSHNAANVIKSRYRKYKVDQCNTAVPLLWDTVSFTLEHHNRYSHNAANVINRSHRNSYSATLQALL